MLTFANILQNYTFCVIMTKVGLLSDTHGYLDQAIFDHFSTCDEVWHAGDIGHADLMRQLQQGLGPSVMLRGVFGNIDGADVRANYPETLNFTCEQVNVLIQHIGGYPGKYVSGIKNQLKAQGIGLFVSGHSHILKVMYDDDLQCLHMNPGAAGKQGWHQVRTLLRFVIEGTNFRDCEVIELGLR